MGAQEARPDHGLIGRILGGKFRLRSYIGAGSSGTVYQADQVTLGRTVAVKILNPDLAEDTRLVSRFHDEAMAASRLNHPNTVSVIDYGQTEDGLLFIVMEYLRGVTLTQVIEEQSPLSTERIVDIASQILSGLEEAHEAGVVHADLKSDNIVVEHRRGGWYLVKVVDFGIARIMGAPREEEEERTICGTPEYMAPEVISGHDPTFASDLYAVGIILYEMLTGETPFVGGSSIEVLTRHIRQEPTPPRVRRRDLTIDGKLEQVAMRALAKHPVDRFASATDLRVALEAALTRRGAKTEEQVLCSACGVYSPVRFNFCPECGAPRAAAPLVDTIPGLSNAPAGVPATPITNDDEPTEGIAHEPTPAATPLSEDTAGSIFPLPIVGRAKLIDELLEFIDGTGQVFLSLSGVSGMGRTRVLDELERRLEGREDMVVYRASPDPSGLHAPLYPLRGLVAAVLALPPVCPYDRLSAGLEILGLSRRDLPGVAELFGHHGELWQLEPEVRRRELFASTIRVIKAATARHGRAVFLLDDVDRYDQPSQVLLDSLAALEDVPLRILATHEPDFAEIWPAKVRRQDLSPLTEGDLGELATHLEQMAQDRMLTAAALTKSTGGNPNHIQHLVRFVVEGGELEGAPLPLADLIAERIGALPPAARLLCQAAAVFGQVADRDLLRHALGKRLEGATFETALSVARGRGLLCEIRDGSAFGFSHSLVRDVIYDATPADVRRELHECAVHAMEPVTTEPLLLGHHHEMAGNRIEAATLLMRAGDDAVHQLDDAGAIVLYQRALAAARQLMLADDEVKSRIRFVMLSVKLADALRVSGQVSLARGIIEEAHGHSRGAPRLEAQLLQAGAHLSVSEDGFDQAIDCLRRSIGMVIPVGDMELLAELYLDLSAVFMRAGSPEEAISELREGLDLVTLGEGAAATAGPKQLWRLLLRMAQLYSSTKRLSEAVPLAERALVHARRIRSRIGSARVQSLLASYCEQLGDLRLADQYRNAAVSEMRRLGDRRGTAELLLAGVVPTRTLTRISPANLREARELADEVGWDDGVAQASGKTNQIKDL
ncbi:protein kinase domain-containing protein [Haliangium sp.]|uniref:serine/threonine-protein kinase n=1 Tax=Haliangium sp. TaxID=2663208 RepID=UPI003D10C40A